MGAGFYTSFERYMWGGMVGMTTKLEFARKCCESSSITKRPFFKLPDAKLLVSMTAALMLSGPFVLPKFFSPKAQDATSAASVPQKQVKVQYIPLNDIKRSVTDAEAKYKIATSERTTYTAILSDSTEVDIGFQASSGGPATPGEAGDHVLVGIWKGESSKAYEISLSELKAAYTQFSGKELKYVRVGVKICRDAAGEYAEFAIVPVASKDGEIAAGTPIGRIQGSLEGVGSKGCEDTAKVLLSLK
jgi:hypothetical protein